MCVCVCLTLTPSLMHLIECSHMEVPGSHITHAYGCAYRVHLAEAKHSIRVFFFFFFFPDRHCRMCVCLQNLEDMAFPKAHNIIDVVKRVCYREIKATA